jgi:lysophospholipase L1-like esterase
VCSKATIISDSICKFIRHCRNTTVQAFPGATCEKILTKLRLGRIAIEFAEIIIIHIGTNDLEGNKPQEVIDAVLKVIEYIQSKNPTSKIVYSSIIQRPKDSSRSDFIRKYINNQLKYWAKSKNFYFVKSYRSLKETTHFAKDGLHLNRQGFVALRSYFEKTVSRLLARK